MNKSFEQIKNKAEQKPKVDWFLNNPPVQPKLEIAGYIESANIDGLKIPQRYSFGDGYELSGEREIIFRTEHPDEYAGDSGVGDSYKYGPESRPDTLEELQEDLRNKNEKKIKNHYIQLDEDPESKFEQSSYSAWEYIPGVNKTVFRDDVISGKYHVFSSWTDEEAKEKNQFSSRGNYMQIENGEVIFEGGHGNSEELRLNNMRLAEFYEQINALEKFDNEHSPIMEFQESEISGETEYYFLQTHRGRNRSERDFILEDERDGYILVNQVRGKTPPEGIHVFFESYKIKIPEGVERRSSFNKDGYGHVPLRNMREIEVVLATKNLEKRTDDISISHYENNTIMKPKLVLFPEERINYGDVIDIHDEETFDSLQFQKDYLKENGVRIRPIDFSYHAHVISDGRKAFISEPDYAVHRFHDRKNELLVEVKITKDKEVSIESKPLDSF